MTFANYLQTQPLLPVASVLVLGMVVGDKLVGLFPLWIWIGIIVACLLMELSAKEKPYLQSFIIYIAIFFAGVALIIKGDNASVYPFNGDAPLNYEAVVINEPQIKGKVLKCDITITSIDSHELDKPITVKAAILRDTIDHRYRNLKIGSGIKAMSVMQPLQNYRQGSNFDYVRYLHCHGFTAQTFIFHSDWQQSRVSLAPLSRLARLKLKALKFRNNLISSCIKSCNDEDQESAIIAAMVLGDKHALTKETKDVYSISGASHVLALSGLHLGIIYAILTLLFGKGYRRRWLSQAIIIIAIWMYVVLVGMGTSVIRSAVMITIYSLCLVAGRSKASLNSLSLAGITILIINPLSLWDIGFQMSFMAVLSIVIFYSPIYHLVPTTGKPILNRFISLVWGTAVVSISAQIGTAPLIIYYFGRFSCYFLLTNYIVIPCATVIIYGTLAVFITLPLHSLCSFISKILMFVTDFLNSSVSWIASLPGACIDNIHINTVQLICYYIAVTIITIICSSCSAFLRAGQTHLQQKHRL